MRLSRKERLRKQQRLGERKLNRAERNAADVAEEEFLRAEFSKLPEEEQKVLAALCAIRCNYPGWRHHRLTYPCPELLEEWGVRDLDQKQVVYLLWCLGVFVGDCVPHVIPWLAVSGMCGEIGLGVDSANFLKVLESLDIPGLKFTPEFSGRLEKRDRIPYLFNFTFQGNVVPERR